MLHYRGGLAVGSADHPGLRPQCLLNTDPFWCSPSGSVTAYLGGQRLPAGRNIAGYDRRDSARRAFRALYVPGMTALVSDAIGFVTMVLIPIQVIKDLGIAASIGVAVVVLTNLVLLPIMMSYIGITLKTLEHHRRPAAATSCGVRTGAAVGLASARAAPLSIAVAASGFALGIYGGQNLQIGDLDPGAPELHGFPLQPRQPYITDERHQLRHTGGYGGDRRGTVRAVPQPGTG